ncbi:hypothetical protein RAMLITH_13470 [Ramlibacter sp. RBP-2]|uniref:Doubled CXXCH motif domain-containing protein n=1 Tax=Ramlibacter lithotrophicus TaxID=2606681 RepID=A0A7X6DGQ2_9BURK|nr:cytochrome c3 family protein [Ramlibacter lithotrophicus]NKE66837.1 hypothetical protein [Ramlibacter lithotrophicus]
MTPNRRLLAELALLFALALAHALPAQAQSKGNDDKACLDCHAPLVQKKVVHAAAHMSCASCHAELDASSVPHRSKGKRLHGLSAEGPILCANCHDKQLFEGKVVHGPVAAGMCLGCHDPHASENIGLLTKRGATLCLDCHPEVQKGPHLIAGFTRSGHPLGNDPKQVLDPLRPGKAFYCAGCHEPHRSRRPKLTRFDSGTASCQNCHKM